MDDMFAFEESVSDEFNLFNPTDEENEYENELFKPLPN